MLPVAGESGTMSSIAESKGLVAEQVGRDRVPWSTGRYCEKRESGPFMDRICAGKSLRLRDIRVQIPYAAEQGNKSDEQGDKIDDQGIKSTEHGTARQTDPGSGHRRRLAFGAELAPGAAKPIIGGEGRHPHALMRDTWHDNAAPAAGHAELCGFGLPAGKVELRPRKPVWPLRYRRFVPRKVLGRTVDVLVAGKDDQRVAKKTNDILSCQPDAAEPVGIGKVERRQRIPAGIGGSDRRENAVRLRRQQPVDKLPAGGMAPQIGLVAPRHAGFAQ